jgi:hypothetical protein
VNRRRFSEERGLHTTVINGQRSLRGRFIADADSLICLAAAVEAASSKPLPIIAENVPASVEITAHRGPRGLAVVLVHQTCNQYLADAVRYIVPLQNLRLTVGCGVRRIRSVETVTGARLEWRQRGNQVDLSLPNLGAVKGFSCSDPPHTGADRLAGVVPRRST